MSVFVLVLEPLVESGEAHVGTELLEKDLHKDPAGRRRGFLTHPDTLQHLVERHPPDTAETEREEENSTREKTVSCVWLDSIEFNLSIWVYAYTPGNRVCVEQVSEQSGHIPQFVGLQSMNRVVLLRKNTLKTFHVLFLQQTEPLQTHTQKHTHRQTKFYFYVLIKINIRTWQ